MHMSQRHLENPVDCERLKRRTAEAEPPLEKVFKQDLIPFRDGLRGHEAPFVGGPSLILASPRTVLRLACERERSAKFETMIQQSSPCRPIKLNWRACKFRIAG
jgi:hypothetical protein